jgi:hypothetical protein
MIGKLAIASLVLVGITGTGISAVNALSDDRPGDGDRYFSGTIAGEPFVFQGGIEIDITVDDYEGPHTHILADVVGRNYRNNCGAWTPGSFMDGEDDWWGAVGDKRLEQMVGRMLPIGTEVEGYMALAESEFVLGGAQDIAQGDGTKQEAVSYLHLGPVESTSVNESLVATGWAKSWDAFNGSSLEADDPVVQREHEAVVAVEKGPGLRRVEAICGDREREDDERREELRERRHIRHLAEVAAAKKRHAETMRLYGGDRWRETMGFNDDDSSSGGYSSGGTPNYCPPGGC